MYKKTKKMIVFLSNVLYIEVAKTIKYYFTVFGE